MIVSRHARPLFFLLDPQLPSTTRPIRKLQLPRHLHFWAVSNGHAISHQGWRDASPLRCVPVSISIDSNASPQYAAAPSTLCTASSGPASPLPNDKEHHLVSRATVCSRLSLQCFIRRLCTFPPLLTPYRLNSPANTVISTANKSNDRLELCLLFVRWPSPCDPAGILYR